MRKLIKDLTQEEIDLICEIQRDNYSRCDECVLYHLNVKNCRCMEKEIKKFIEDINKEVEVPVELAYCSRCDKDVSFNTQEVSRTVTIRGVTFRGIIFNYNHVIANCNICGERVFPVSLGTLNDKTKYEELEKEKKDKI